MSHITTQKVLRSVSHPSLRAQEGGCEISGQSVEGARKQEEPGTGVGMKPETRGLRSRGSAIEMEGSVLSTGIAVGFAAPGRHGSIGFLHAAGNGHRPDNEEGPARSRPGWDGEAILGLQVLQEAGPYALPRLPQRWAETGGGGPSVSNGLAQTPGPHELNGTAPGRGEAETALDGTGLSPNVEIGAEKAAAMAATMCGVLSPPLDDGSTAQRSGVDPELGAAADLQTRGAQVAWRA